MLSPNEIANTKFDKAMGRGYKAEDVENFLRQVAADFSAALQDKQSAEEKIVVLADKLEEYRRDEESMRSALIGAQKLGDSVVRDAKAKAAAIIDDANGRAQLLLDNARKTIEREQVAYAKMQREVAAFKSKLQHLYKQHLEMISALPADDGILETDISKVVRQEEIPAPRAPESEPIPQYEPIEPEVQYEPEPVEAYEFAEPAYIPPIPETVEAYDLPPDDLPEYQDEYEEEPYEEEQPRNSKFGTLRFGQQYSISRTDKRKK